MDTECIDDAVPPHSQRPALRAGHEVKSYRRKITREWRLSVVSCKFSHVWSQRWPSDDIAAGGVSKLGANVATVLHVFSLSLFANLSRGKIMIR